MNATARNGAPISCRRKRCRCCLRDAMWEMSFNRTFFERLAQECEIAERFPAPPEGDGSEYNAEEAERERYRKLGVRNGSRFLNIGVDNQVTWPKEEKLV